LTVKNPSSGECVGGGISFDVLRGELFPLHPAITFWEDGWYTGG
jgi:hypothetical protein